MRVLQTKFFCLGIDIEDEVTETTMERIITQILSQRAQSDAVQLTAIRQSFTESDGIYGSSRMHRDLREAGWQCGENRVARLMPQAYLKSLRGYRKPRFKSGKPAIAAPNRLQQRLNTVLIPLRAIIFTPWPRIPV